MKLQEARLKIMDALQQATDHQLQEELARRGYCISAVWHKNDVLEALSYYNKGNGTNHSLTESECMNILDSAFGARDCTDQWLELADALEAHIYFRENTAHS